MTKDNHYIIAVDFDQTLIKGNHWPDVEGEPNGYLIRHLKILKEEDGTKLILNTCRTGEALQAAVNWCKAQGLEFDAVNENLPELIEAYGQDTRKISADIYIDDCACHPDSYNWSFANAYGLKLTNHWLYTKEIKA